jgi:hypothetical protein
MSKTGRTWAREVKRFYWIDASSSKLLYAKAEVAPEVTGGRAPPPQGLVVKEISLDQSLVSVESPSSSKIVIQSMGKSHILQSSSTADQQRYETTADLLTPISALQRAERWFKHLRSASLKASIANVYANAPFPQFNFVTFKQVQHDQRPRLWSFFGGKAC